MYVDLKELHSSVQKSSRAKPLLIGGENSQATRAVSTFFVFLARNHNRQPTMVWVSCWETCLLHFTYWSSTRCDPSQRRLSSFRICCHCFSALPASAMRSSDSSSSIANRLSFLFLLVLATYSASYASKWPRKTPIISAILGTFVVPSLRILVIASPSRVKMDSSTVTESVGPSRWPVPPDHMQPHAQNTELAVAVETAYTAIRSLVGILAAQKALHATNRSVLLVQPNQAVPWISEIEKAKTLEKLFTSHSVTGTDFETLDSKTLDGLIKILHGDFRWREKTQQSFTCCGAWRRHAQFSLWTVVCAKLLLLNNSVFQRRIVLWRVGLTRKCGPVVGNSRWWHLCSSLRFGRGRHQVEGHQQIPNCGGRHVRCFLIWALPQSDLAE